MALGKLHELLEEDKKIIKYEKYTRGKLSGIVTLEIAKAKISKGGNAEFVKASYAIPELTDNIRFLLENVCEDVNCVYSARKASRLLRDKGLNSVISIPFSAIPERKNIENMKKINEILGFPNY